MIVLKAGTAHKHKVWLTTCDTCESELRILQGDPLATDPVIYNCDWRQYSVRYICPICRAKGRAKTIEYAGFDGEGNAIYKEDVLTKEDREDIEHWNDLGYANLTKEEIEWISNRMA